MNYDHEHERSPLEVRLDGLTRVGNTEDGGVTTRPWSLVTHKILSWVTDPLSLEGEDLCLWSVKLVSTDNRCPNILFEVSGYILDNFLHV